MLVTRGKFSVFSEGRMSCTCLGWLQAGGPQPCTVYRRPKFHDVHEYDAIPNMQKFDRHATLV